MGKHSSDYNDPASHEVDLKPFIKKSIKNEVKKSLGKKYEDAILDSGEVSAFSGYFVVGDGITPIRYLPPVDISAVKKLPIISFESREELDKYLEEWQDRLFLSDWIIKVNIIPADEYNEVDSTGYCDCWRMHNTASIYLKEYNEKDNCPKKIPQELCLVHELLHLKIERIDKDSKDPFVKRYNDNIHQLVEQQAVSLLCAKYNITKDWFKNF